MIFTKFKTENDWGFGIGWTYASEGKAIPGYWTIRPGSFYVNFGPWTFEWEKPGRVDIYSN